MKYCSYILINLFVFICFQGFSFQFAQQEQDEPEVMILEIVNDLSSLQQDFTQLIDRGVQIPSFYDYMHDRLIDFIDDDNDVFAEKFHKTVCDARMLITKSLLSEGFNLLQENKIKRNAKAFPTFTQFIAEDCKFFENGSCQEQENCLKKATTVMGIYMKDIFKNKLSKALSSCQKIQDVQDPIFQYLIRNSSGLMKSRCLLWVNQLSDEMGCQCLLAAAGRHNMSAVQFLVELGVDINDSLNQYKRTALYNAALHNCSEIVAFLIDHGADVNIVDIKGTSPLMAAVFHNYQNIAEQLIEAGADCWAQNVNGLTPLSIAHKKNYKQLEALLLSKKLPEYIA